RLFAPGAQPQHFHQSWACVDHCSLYRNLSTNRSMACRGKLVLAGGELAKKPRQEGRGTERQAGYQVSCSCSYDGFMRPMVPAPSVLRLEIRDRQDGLLEPAQVGQVRRVLGLFPVALFLLELLGPFPSPALRAAIGEGEDADIAVPAGGQVDPAGIRVGPGQEMGVVNAILILVNEDKQF